MVAAGSSLVTGVIVGIRRTEEVAAGACSGCSSAGCGCNAVAREVVMRGVACDAIAYVGEDTVAGAFRVGMLSVRTEAEAYFHTRSLHYLVSSAVAGTIIEEEVFLAYELDGIHNYQVVPVHMVFLSCLLVSCVHLLVAPHAFPA